VIHEWAIAINNRAGKPVLWAIGIAAIAAFILLAPDAAILAVNTAAWVMANLLVAYIAVVLIVFVLGYYLLFDPKATTAGRFVFRFALSLIGVIGLVVISLFVDPSVGRKWFEYPGDILDWRPLGRLVIYAYVSYTITGLAVLLGYRKWRPEYLRVAPDVHDLVKPRTLS
jgi:hypothetical protein